MTGVAAVGEGLTVKSGGGIGTLSRVLVKGPKSALSAKTLHSDSHSNIHFGAQVWAKCGHEPGRSVQ